METSDMMWIAIVFKGAFVSRLRISFSGITFPGYNNGYFIPRYLEKNVFG
jgi:hypothetical protein